MKQSTHTQPLTYFIDPPYDNTAGCYYKFNSVNYSHLAAWCYSRTGQVIVCENQGASWWLDFKTLGGIKATNGKYRSGISKEVVWVNET